MQRYRYRQNSIAVSFNTDTIRSLVDRHSVISFDIFDTLLLRPYVNPTDVWKHIEWMTNTTGFYDARCRAVAAAVKRQRGEFTIDEAYNEIDARYQKFKELEMRLERQILTVNSEIYEVYEYAVQRGKRVIAVSDMYLPESFLKSILHEKGYHHIETLYVSSQYRKMKSEGLFEIVIEKEKTHASSILHIGDNYEADQLAASRAKIHSVLYEKRISNLLNNNKHAYMLQSKNHDDLSASILLGLLSITIRNREAYWGEFGFMYAGPAILGWMKWLKKALYHDKITDVLFVARDGYTPQKVFNIIGGDSYPTYYFYSPRKNAILINFDYTYHHGMGTTLIMDHLRKSNLLIDKDFPQSDDLEKQMKYVEKNRDRLYKLLENDRLAYTQYLRSFHFNGRNIAIVDAISASASAHRVVQTCLPSYNIRGYYFFKRPGYSNKSLILSSYHTEDAEEIVNYLIWEFIMTAPTPPANRIENGRVVFNNVTSEEAHTISIYPNISRGAERFAELSQQVFGPFDFPMSDSVIIDWINQFCDHPTENDRKIWADVKIGWHLEHLFYEYVMYNWYKH